MNETYLFLDYRLRIKKCIERKLFCEFLNEYNRLFCLEEFDYIGFGSLYFSDFILFHKQYEFKKFISIEDMNNSEGEFNNEKNTRFLFNKPYDFIEIIEKKSTTALNELECEKAIIWLDYDERLENYMFEDVRIIAEKLISGSIIIVTLNERIRKEIAVETVTGTRYNDETLFNEYYKNNVYDGIGRTDITRGKYSNTVKKIFEYNIGKVLKNRIKIDGKKYSLHQLSYLKYSDGAPMVTFIYGLYSEQELKIVIESDIVKKSIYNTTDSAYEIKAPLLTEAERNFINRNLQVENSEIQKQIGLSQDEIEEYKKYYRHYPNFKEVLQ